MMNARTFQRHLSSVLSLAPGQYTTETADGGIAVACPECGGVSELEHVVSKDGRVHLLWQCPYACLYSAYLTLEDWLEPVLR